MGKEWLGVGSGQVLEMEACKGWMEEASFLGEEG